MKPFPPDAGGDALPELAEGFGLLGWFVQPRLNRMARDGTTVQVEPKVMQVLVALARHAGEPVTRENLFDTVWPDTVVTDDVLTRCVSELRKLFDDDARRPQVVETIPRVGYRLMPPLALRPSGDSSTGVAHIEVTAGVGRARVEGHTHRLYRPWMVAVLAVAIGAVAWMGLRRTPVRQAEPLLRPRPLTSLPGRETMAALSPDGRSVAFVWDRDDGSVDLYTSATEALVPLRLTHDAAQERAPTWSPDGTRLAFARIADGNCDVYTVPALGGPATHLARCGGTFISMDASPDGRWLAVSDKQTPDDIYRLALIDAATGARRQLAFDTAGSQGDFSPTFSPDGQTILFMRSVGEGQSDLFTIDPEAGTLHRLSSEKAAIGGQAWSPDGRSIYFTSMRAGGLGLWRITADGGPPASVLPALAGMRLDAAAGHLVYEQWQVDSDVYEATLDGTDAPQPISPSTRADVHPQYAPGGDRVLFLSDRSGTQQLWISDAGGTHAEQLTTDPDRYVFGARWSPETEAPRIAFAAYDDGQADVYVLDRPAGGKPRRLTRSAANDVYPSWSPDGRWVYFGSDRSGRMELWRVPAGGGEAVRVTDEGGFISQPSEDGAWVFYTKEGVSGLWRRPAAGGDETQVLDDLDLSHAFNWALGDGTLYVLTHATSPPRIVAYDLASGSSRTVRRLDASAAGSGFALSPDATHVLFVRIDRRDADLMIVDGLR